MSYRFMRVLVLFDLPTKTTKDRREYTAFRKFLIKSGFIMMQESVYSKIAVNQNAAAAVCESLKKKKPPAGIVEVLIITEKQFSKMEIIVGERKSDIIDTDERFLII